MENNSKNLYYRVILIVIILLLGGIIFYQGLPFLGGVLGGCTVYLLVRNQMSYLVDKKKIKPAISALLILLEVILCILIPVLIVLMLLINRASNIDLDPNALMHTIEHFVGLIQQKTGYDIISSNNLSAIASTLTDIAQKLVGQISSFLINCVVLVLVLYFMLLGGKKMEEYIYDILPFNDKNKREVVTATKLMIKSNAIGIPLLAIIQGFFAMVGYIILGTPNPVLFGLLTCFATIIPLIGTALIWVPLSLYLLLSGNIASGVGLVIYAVCVISNIDNVVRFWLQKKLADTHPLITVFGVVMGLSVFGFWGVIFGPLMLSIFLLCFDLYKKEYIDK